MAITVNFSAPLIKKTGGEKRITLNSKNIKEMIKDLKKRFPDLIEIICNEEEELNGLVSVYLNDDDIKSLDGAQTMISDGSEVFIIPTIAGG